MDLVADIPSTVMFPGTTISLMSVLSQNYGLFNGATVTVDTLYWPIGERYTTLWSPGNASYATQQGTIRIWLGQVGNVKSTGRSQVTLECYDMLYILNRQTPPNLIQSGCRHTLFDAGCALVESGFTVSSSVAAGSTSLAIVMSTTVTQGATYYVQGRLKFTSGNNGGLVFPIKTQTLNGSVTTLGIGNPIPFPLVNGDTFTLVPGCDKSLATCQSKFNNIIHFGGTPFVPNPEIA
jgi:uncharacterized phage protein (TIGR02218 family)